MIEKLKRWLRIWLSIESDKQGFILELTAHSGRLDELKDIRLTIQSLNGRNAELLSIVAARAQQSDRLEALCSQQADRLVVIPAAIGFRVNEVEDHAKVTRDVLEAALEHLKLVGGRIIDLEMDVTPEFMAAQIEDLNKRVVDLETEKEKPRVRDDDPLTAHPSSWLSQAAAAERAEGVRI